MDPTTKSAKREELLKQLKEIDEKIAQKRAKLKEIIKKGRALQKQGYEVLDQKKADKIRQSIRGT